jgi:50S ribosomal subunit-associated GTPase HflX
MNDDQTAPLIDSRTYFLINKIDCIDDAEQLASYRHRFPNAWQVSLKDGTGMEDFASGLRTVVERE